MIGPSSTVKSARTACGCSESELFSDKDPPRLGMPSVRPDALPLTASVQIEVVFQLVPCSELGTVVADARGPASSLLEVH